MAEASLREEIEKADLPNEKSQPKIIKKQIV
jgi:hypothetical protein